MIRAVCMTVMLSFPLLPLGAQEFRALARVDPEQSHVQDDGDGVVLQLGLSQAVPFRVGLTDAPLRLVLDTREVIWDGLPEDFDAADAVTLVATGAAGNAPGWSRMVLHLDRPMGVETAAMATDAQDGTARISIRLAPVSAETFAASLSPLLDGPIEIQTPLRAVGPLVVVLDPGHGGIDPGAQADGHNEADLMLLFARELRDVLIRTGQADVILTRDSDAFVPLPDRVSQARAAGADLFISLHADALAEGRATGATVYTLSDTASDAASAALAERFDRTDLLSGVDLGQADDAVAGVLMDLARLDTDPRSDALADALVASIGQTGDALYRHPRLEAGFTVLTAADIPSVLVEIGFMSDPRDLENILDPEWRLVMQEAMRDAILTWADEDAAGAALRRQ